MSHAHRPFTLFDVRPGRVEMQVRTPAQYGLAPCTVSDLAEATPRTTRARSSGAVW